jgi:hypothetical protein
MREIFPFQTNNGKFEENDRKKPLGLPFRVIPLAKLVSQQWNLCRDTDFSTMTDSSHPYETPEYFGLPFPYKLAMILEKEDPSIIQWSKNGRSFRIVNYEQFTDAILPKYFSRKFIHLLQMKYDQSHIPFSQFQMTNSPRSKDN